MKPIRIMGIDPAFANVGVALGSLSPDGKVVDVQRLTLITTEPDKSGKKVVRKNSDDLRRCREIFTQLTGVIEEWQPAVLFAEIPSGAQNARSAATLGMATAIIACLPRPLVQLMPAEVKKATGIKNPDKEDMIAWAFEQHPGANWATYKRDGQEVLSAAKNEHLADAVAAIHAGIATEQFRGMLSLLRGM